MQFEKNRCVCVCVGNSWRLAALFHFIGRMFDSTPTCVGGSRDTSQGLTAVDAAVTTFAYVQLNHSLKCTAQRLGLWPPSMNRFPTSIACHFADRGPPSTVVGHNLRQFLVTTWSSCWFHLLGHLYSCLHSSSSGFSLFKIVDDILFTPLKFGSWCFSSMDSSTHEKSGIFDRQWI